MKVIIGNDHGAVESKLLLVHYLEQKGITVVNKGVDSEISIDYPDIAENLCNEFLENENNYDFGILLCGTGMGISMAANKIPGIRAALPQNSYAATMAKEHNNANIIVFGGRVEYTQPITEILEAFISAQFQGGRHQSRIDKMMALDQK